MIETRLSLVLKDGNEPPEAGERTMMSWVDVIDIHPVLPNPPPVPTMRAVLLTDLERIILVFRVTPVADTAKPDSPLDAGKPGSNTDEFIKEPTKGNQLPNYGHGV